jgi:hypothetical protein
MLVSEFIKGGFIRQGTLCHEHHDNKTPYGFQPEKYTGEPAYPAHDEV